MSIKKFAVLDLIDAWAIVWRNWALSNFYGGQIDNHFCSSIYSNIIYQISNEKFADLNLIDTRAIVWRNRALLQLTILVGNKSNKRLIEQTILTNSAKSEKQCHLIAHPIPMKQSSLLPSMWQNINCFGLD